MTSAEYWEDRAKQNALKADRYAQRQADLVTRWFKRAGKEIDAKIVEFYKRYADKEGLTLPAAKAVLANTKDAELTMAEYYVLIGNGLQVQPEVKALLDRVAAKRAIQRQELLRLQLQLVLDTLYTDYDKLTLDTLTATFENSYYKGIFDFQQFQGFGGGFNRISTNDIAAAASTNWSGKNYSERIWGSQRMSLARRVNRIVSVGVTLGKPNAEMRQELQKEMDTSAYNARRLIRTETNYIHGEAAFRAYRQNGTERYEFCAVLDLHTSEICRYLDGKVFAVADRRVGVNCNPMHPFCRSTTVPYVPDEEFDADDTRIARGADGYTYKVPADMTYAQWHKQYVENVPEAALTERMLRNIYSDKKQFEKYNGVLGKEMPKPLEDFQQMKYTGGVEWEKLKSFYRYKRKYPGSDRTYFDIDQELQALKNQGLIDKRIGVAVKPQPVKMESYGTHALQRMFERHFGTEDAQKNIDRAIIAFDQFKGTRTAYYGDAGVTCVLNRTNEMITGWMKEDHDENTDKVLEVAHRYGK